MVCQITTCVGNPKRGGHQQSYASFVELEEVLEYYAHIPQEKGDAHRQILVFMNPTALEMEKNLLPMCPRTYTYSEAGLKLSLQRTILCTLLNYEASTCSRAAPTREASKTKPALR